MSFHLPSVEELTAYRNDVDEALGYLDKSLAFVEKYENLVPGLSRFSFEIAALKYAVEWGKVAIDHVPL